jgi:RHS repeat-associated protein
MTCRAPTSGATCAGTPTGAVLTYDNEGRLSAWQNAPTSPTTTDSFLYDGAGNRVEQSVTVGGSITTTTTYVAGGSEEVVSGSSGTTLTKYFSGASGLPTAERVSTGGPLSYLATDGQGTVSEALDGSGNVASQQLYTPYGTGRYTNGTSPTSLGYTGQRADTSTGLDYYHARYYDPVAGQFTSADSQAYGLNRYGYVGGNPTTATDPSGHMACSADFGACVAPTHYKGHKREITPGPKPKKPGPKPKKPGPKTGCGGKQHCSPSGGKPVSCRVDENQGDGSPCNEWSKWRDAAIKVRNSALDSERSDAKVYAWSALVGVLVGGVAEFIATKSPIRALEILVTILDWSVDALSWTATLDPRSASQAYHIMGIVASLLAVANRALAILGGGFFFRAIFDVAFRATLTTAGGLPVLLISIAVGIVGNLMQGVAQYAFSQAAGLVEDITNQGNMNIWDWCAVPGRKCDPEPNGGIPLPTK